jgi:hypothetical protein
VRRTTALITLAIAATSCDAGSAPDGGAAFPPATTAACDATNVVEESALAGPDILFPWDATGTSSVDEFDTAELLRGGPPPDGIVPIDTPCVTPASVGDSWLAGDESVLVVDVDGAARAYPLSIMTQHEIVNDVLGGAPLTVTYCPLCNSGVAFERTLDGAVWSFGTSGRLLRSNLVMYDRQTRTLWSQLSGTALWGDPDVVGRELVRLPTQVLGWDSYRAAYPDGTVLSRDSVPGRTYGRNPYPSYEDNPSAFLFRGERSDALDPNERVVGVRATDGSDAAVAVPLSVLMADEAVTIPVGSDAVTVTWIPGQASALDGDQVADGRDVGQTGAFLVDKLEATGDGTFRDPATGALHDITGRTVQGTAAALTRVALDDTFWFVWFAFFPNTAIAG